MTRQPVITSIKFQEEFQIEAEDVLPDISRTQAAQGPKTVFVPGDLDL